MRRNPVIAGCLVLGVIGFVLDRRPCAAEDRPRPSDSPASDRDIVRRIDELLADSWREANLTPSAEATDGEWCRRAYLDILGRIPRIDETQAYVASRSPGKREELARRLLALDGDGPYAGEYGRNWSTIWTNWLIGRSGGVDRRGLARREGLEAYLRGALSDNVPLAALARELIAAEGSNRPGDDDFNGAVNFVLAHLQLNNRAERTVQVTARTSRVFLGLQVQCTQCHNHPFNEAKQEQFWSLDSFFRQTAVLRTFEGRDLVSVRLADEDFGGDAGDNPLEPAVFYERRDGQLKAAPLRFVDGRTVDAVGYVDEVNRRDKLAELVASSELLPRAAVNRYWEHFQGYGFTRPVDDMGPHHPPSHPEVLEALAEGFASGGYDLKRLALWIVLSKPYGLSSRGNDRNAADDPALGKPPAFSRFYLRQMRAEELYESLLVATQADRAGASSEGDRQERRADWLRQFTLAFGTDDNGEATTFNGTIPQVLMMMNGDLMRRATSCEPGSFLHEVAVSEATDAQKVQRLYLAALARRPTGAESKLALRLWQARGGDTPAALEDLWWALLNSNEFLLNH